MHTTQLLKKGKRKNSCSIHSALLQLFSVKPHHCIMGGVPLSFYHVKRFEKKTIADQCNANSLSLFKYNVNKNITEVNSSIPSQVPIPSKGACPQPELSHTEPHSSPRSPSLSGISTPPSDPVLKGYDCLFSYFPVVSW